VNSDPPRSLFFKARVTVLLSVLFCVVVWAGHDIWSRRARKEWKRTLEIGVVIVQVDHLDEEAVSRVRDRLPALEARLAAEMNRYRPGAPRPFHFILLGPVAGVEPPIAPGESFFEVARHTYDLWQYRRDLDARAHVITGAFDSRIYLAAKGPVSERRQTIEGESEENGRIGTVTVELNGEMADLALAVVTHEVLHTLGASDKYDVDGHALVPLGFAEPDRVPRYPQRFVEVMARGRPVAPGVEKPPASLDEIAIGKVTATEIGWIEAKAR
jgi:hypothetical protein